MAFFKKLFVYFCRLRGHSQRTSAVFFEIFDPPSPTSAHVHRLAPPLLWTSVLGMKTPLAMHFF